MLNSLRLDQGKSNAYMWGCVIPGFVLACFAAYHGSVLMMLAAFLVVCGFRLYEEQAQSKWSPLFRSIIEKYEQAAVSSDFPAVTNQDSS